VDVALWDIKGKALRTPVYNLLGGKSRAGVLVYCHATGQNIDALRSMRRKTKHAPYNLRTRLAAPNSEFITFRQKILCIYRTLLDFD
ncbi:MAG: hypothetical protein ABSE51_24555, partial [Terracidiphilus sp.]|jgi:mannonate dehydratase